MPRRNTRSSHTLPSTPTGTAPPTRASVPRPERPGGVTLSLEAAAQKLDKTMQKVAPNTNHRLHIAIDKAVPQVHRALHNGVDAVFKSKLPYNPAAYAVPQPQQNIPHAHPSVPPPPPPVPYYRPNQPAQQSPPPAIVEYELLQATNAARAARNLRAVQLSPALTSVAKAHAKDLARSSRPITHIGADGSTLGTRLARSGYEHAHAVENLAQGRGGVAEVFKSWVKSPEQKRNIFDTKVNEMGSYVVAAPDGSLIWVQVLAVRR